MEQLFKNIFSPDKFLKSKKISKTNHTYLVINFSLINDSDKVLSIVLNDKCEIYP